SRTAWRTALRTASSLVRWHSRAPWRTISSADAVGGSFSTSNGLSLIARLLFWLLLLRPLRLLRLVQLGQQVADVGVGRVQRQRLAVQLDLARPVRLDEAAHLVELRQRRPPGVGAGLAADQ